MSDKIQLVCADCGKDIVVLADKVIPCTCLRDALTVETEEGNLLRAELAELKNHAYVWAGSDPFTGEQVLGLLNENDRLRKRVIDADEVVRQIKDVLPMLVQYSSARWIAEAINKYDPLDKTQKSHE